ncbi:MULTISPECIES: hypothetical protein [unclassified Microbacterium]|uniref:hypothetical protein n=1 Tax=unclassified Microbacterium TaxID=2609290 RepID=UPI00214A8BF7|nr:MULTISPECIES: hypothetical protein [unclassified Microbacterium]MCR2810305.1 hypothetical protein [Microbacterium sp. zg.B185]WIM18367.1 hypothetical protein QNO12_12255 [Microbacterium sp. zg-B185]
MSVRDRLAAVCADCAPGIEAAARRLDLLPDGRTRAAAQDALITRLLEDSDDVEADLTAADVARVGGAS